MQEENKSLREKATSGVIWSAFERFGQQGCVFIVQLFLARLLAPEEFGLIAMVAVFIAISTAVTDAGFGRAIIQKKEINDRELSTVFYFNLITGVAMMGALIGIAPLVAGFYDQPALKAILSWLSISLLLGSAGGVHAAILGRNMHFKKLFWVSFPATLLAGIVGIAFAFLGYGVWALVMQMLSLQFIRTITLWFQTGWRPQWVFETDALRALFPFGSRLAVSAIIASIFNNLYVLVIGKLFSAASVGYFQRARSFQQMPVSSVQAILSRVAFPLFSSIQDDPKRMKRGMSRAIQLGALFAFPAMAGLSVVSEPMIVTLIGEKWLPAVPLLKWLCLLGCLYPLHALNLNVLMALGHSKLFLRLEIIKKLLAVSNILITYRYGVQVMVYGMIVVSFIALYVNTYYTSKYIAYSMWHQLRDLLAITCLSGVMYGVITVLTKVMNLMNLESYIQLLIAVPFGGGIYLLGLRYLNEDLKTELRNTVVKLAGKERWVNIILPARG